MKLLFFWYGLCPLSSLSSSGQESSLKRELTMEYYPRLKRISIILIAFGSLPVEVFILGH